VEKLGMPNLLMSGKRAGDVEVTSPGRHGELKQPRR